MFILSWFLNKSGQWSVHSNINIQVMKIIVWSSNEYGFIVTINCEFIYESPMLTCCNLLLQFFCSKLLHAATFVAQQLRANQRLTFA